MMDVRGDDYLELQCLRRSRHSLSLFTQHPIKLWRKFLCDEAVLEASVSCCCLSCLLQFKEYEKGLSPRTQEHPACQAQIRRADLYRSPYVWHSFEQT